VGKVVKPGLKVLQQSFTTRFETRLSTIESKIEDLKTLILKNKNTSDCNQQKKSKIKRLSRDLNPSRGLHRATC
jgi:hypothetical protein